VHFLLSIKMILCFSNNSKTFLTYVLKLLMDTFKMRLNTKEIQFYYNISVIEKSYQF